MPKESFIKRFQVWIWVLIYGGFLSIVLAYFVADADLVMARVMRIGGALSASAGVVMIFLRARMTSKG